MSKTILTVDDSASVRQMVAFTLNTVGYQVVEAMDGQEAVDKLTTQEVHMLITDLNMPNMNGIDLIQWVRKDTKNKYIPVVMLTTESHREAKEAGKAAGATGWIVKPFNPEQLVAVVKKVLG